MKIYLIVNDVTFGSYPIVEKSYKRKRDAKEELVRLKRERAITKWECLDSFSYYCDETDGYDNGLTYIKKMELIG